MAGLVSKIAPGGSVVASEVADNFDALKAEINNLRDTNFEPGAINSRHIYKSAVATKTYGHRQFGSSASPVSIPATSYGDLGTLDTTGAGFRLVSPADPTPEEAFPVFCTAVFDVWDAGDLPQASIWADVTKGVRYEFKLQYRLDEGLSSDTGWVDFSEASSVRWVTPGSASTAPERKQVVLFAATVPPSGYRVFNFKLVGRTRANTSGETTLDEGDVAGELRAFYAVR